IRGVDVDLDVVVDLRRNEHGGERGMAPVAGIERRLAHEAVDAGLGPQPPVRVVPLEFDRGALHAGHLTGIGVDHFTTKAMRGAPAQIHAQEHLRPVLRLGAAGTGLDIEKRAMRVHLAAKHPFELEAAHLALEPLRILSDVPGGGFIALPFGQLEKLRRIGDAAGGAIDLGDIGAEARTLLPQLLRALRLPPHGRILELPPYLLETLFLAVVLKETPVARRYARLGL